LIFSPSPSLCLSLSISLSISLAKHSRQENRQLGQDFQLTDSGRRSTAGNAEQKKLAATTFDLTMIAGQLAIPKRGSWIRQREREEEGERKPIAALSIDFVNLTGEA